MVDFVNSRTIKSIPSVCHRSADGREPVVNPSRLSCYLVMPSHKQQIEVCLVDQTAIPFPLLVQYKLFERQSWGTLLVYPLPRTIVNNRQQSAFYGIAQSSS